MMGILWQWTTRPATRSIPWLPPSVIPMRIYGGRYDFRPWILDFGLDLKRRSIIMLADQKIALFLDESFAGLAAVHDNFAQPLEFLLRPLEA